MHITQLFSVLALATLATAAPAPAAPDARGPVAADVDVENIIVPRDDWDWLFCDKKAVNHCKASCAAAGNPYYSCRMAGVICSCIKLKPEPHGGGSGGGPSKPKAN